MTLRLIVPRLRKCLALTVPSKFRNITAENGLSPDEVAAMHGVVSGDELVKQINERPTIDKAVKAETQAEMVRRHGDALNDGTLDEMAEQAAHDAEYGKKLASELAFLSRKTKNPAIDRVVLKEYAKTKIGSMPYKQIYPTKYRAAEVRAARKAAIAKDNGNLAEAQRYKQQELINFYLAKEAQIAKDKAENMRSYLASAATRDYKPTDVHPDYSARIKAYANTYDFRKSSKTENARALQTLNALGDWIEVQKLNEDNQYSPQIIDGMLSSIYEASKKGGIVNEMIVPYNNMTVDDLQGVYEQVKNLRYIGGLLSENSKAKFNEDTKTVGASIAENAKKTVSIPNEPSKWDKRLSMLRNFGEDQIALANQIVEMDGYKEFGPLFQDVYQRVIDSSNAELKHKRDTLIKLKDAFKEYKNKDLKEGIGERSVDLANGEKFTLSRRGRIMFGLYWGSTEGREAIKLGHNMTDTDAQKVLDTLYEKDIRLIKSIWAINESFWPEVSRVNQKLTGTVLPKVKHVPYMVNGENMPGGYMKLSYQYNQKDSMRSAKQDDILDTRTGNRLVKQTRNGSRNSRVGSGGRKMNWDLNNVFQALDETIHDISFAENASYISSFMRSENVAGPIIRHYGKEKYESILSSISGIIAGQVSSNHYVNTFMRKFRVAQTYAFLGYSIRNFVQQPVAVTNMFGRLGEAPVAKALIEFYESPKEMMQYVDGKSEFMINRTSLVNRDSAEIMNQFSGNVLTGGLWNSFKHHAFSIQTIGDSMVAYPGWIAAYRDAIKRYGDEKKAVTFADEFIARTIGSGLIKDQSPLLQGGGSASKAAGPEMIKGITFMGSYFNTIYNLSRDAYKQSRKATIPSTKITPEINIPSSPEYYRQMIWYLVVPALLSAALVGQLPNEDDEEGWLAWAFKMSATYGLSQVFILRDIASLFNGYGASSTYTRALDAATKLATEGANIASGEKDIDAHTAAQLVRATGNIATIPASGQAARLLDYIGSDEEFNFYNALVIGKKYNH